MNKLFNILLTFTTVFDPVIMITLLKQICFQNIKTTTQVVTTHDFQQKLVSPQYIEVINKMNFLIPSSVNNVYNDIAKKLKVKYDAEFNKYLLFHIMTYITITILYPTYDTWCNMPFIFIGNGMTKEGLESVRFIVASYYMKVFASQNETIQDVYKYMDNNNITLKLFNSGEYEKYKGFSFYSININYVYIDDYNTYNYLSYFEIYEDYRKSMEIIKLVNNFNKIYDLKDFIRKSLIKKEVFPALCLRSSFNEINESYDKMEYGDSEFFQEYTPKEDHHKSKMKKKHNMKNKKKQQREEKNVKQTKPRGGRRKCQFISQYS